MLLNRLIDKFRRTQLGRKIGRQLRFGGRIYLSLGDTKDKFFRPGWECVDLVGSDFLCDLRYGNLPFPDNSVDAIHASHLIEHLTFDQGRLLVQDCFRCMKRGGVIRFATPDLNQLIGKFEASDWHWFLANGASPIFQRVQAGVLPPEHLLLHNLFVGWLASYSGRFDVGGGPLVDVRIVGDKLRELGRYGFRDWCVSLMDPARVPAHVHVYDYPELHDLFVSAGFRLVRNGKFTDSACPAMQSPSIDRQERAEYSFYIEAEKP